jgi:hypothetical protein
MKRKTATPIAMYIRISSPELSEEPDSLVLPSPFPSSTLGSSGDSGSGDSGVADGKRVDIVAVET